MYTIVTVTIFNKRINRQNRSEEYYPTVIRDASYLESKGVSRSNDGFWSDELNYKIRIPVNAAVQDGREYVCPEVYSTTDPWTTWTVQNGAIILIGAHETDVVSPTELDRYIHDNGLRKITVVQHADNTIRGSMAVRHWRIEGR